MDTYPCDPESVIVRSRSIDVSIAREKIRFFRFVVNACWDSAFRKEEGNDWTLLLR